MSPHDYTHLISRWKKVLQAAGLRLKRIGTSTDGRDDIYAWRTPALKSTGGLYISAGIHGDEPAGTEALLAWAMTLGPTLRELPILCFPCLNPWGLRQNQRLDSQCDDLNRSFHKLRHPLIAALRKEVGDHQFAATIHLHEDYDGEGLYIYEVTKTQTPWADELLDAAKMTRDLRRRIDRRAANCGVIRRRITPRTFQKIGLPEAAWLYFEHSERCYTIETPSEFALLDRVAAQVAMLKRAVELAGVGLHTSGIPRALCQKRRTSTWQSS